VLPIKSCEVVTFDRALPRFSPLRAQRFHTALYGHRPFCQIDLDVTLKRVLAAVLYPACGASLSLLALMEFARNVLISVTHIQCKAVFRFAF
jgi:hypothetical protein